MEQKDPLSIQEDVNLEDDILKKQQLLQTEILDKDLDKDQFIKFCMEKKERGDDLSTWKFEELQQIVKEFQTAHANEPKKMIEDINEEQVGKMEEIDTDAQNLRRRK